MRCGSHRWMSKSEAACHRRSRGYAMSVNRTRSAGRRERAQSAARAAPRPPGIRWLPVPLAMLAAAIGWLVLGGTRGQHAAAVSTQHAHGYQAGGISLSVDTMLWLSNDMTG